MFISVLYTCHVAITSKIEVVDQEHLGQLIWNNPYDKLFCSFKAVTDNYYESYDRDNL